jgi:hypothetical protein
MFSLLRPRSVCDYHRFGVDLSVVLCPWPFQHCVRELKGSDTVDRDMRPGYVSMLGGPCEE